MYKHVFAIYNKGEGASTLLLCKCFTGNLFQVCSKFFPFATCINDTVYLKKVLKEVMIERDDDEDYDDDDNDFEKILIKIILKLILQPLQNASPHHMTKPFRCLFLTLY